MNTSDYSIADMYLDKRDFYGDFVNLKICRRNLSNALVEIEYECMYVCIHINMHTCMHARMWLVYLCLYVEEEEEEKKSRTHGNCPCRAARKGREEYHRSNSTAPPV